MQRRMPLCCYPTVDLGPPGCTAPGRARALRFIRDAKMPLLLPPNERELLGGH